MAGKNKTLRPQRPVLTAVIIILNLTALAIGAYLTYLHLVNPKDPVCNINQAVSCTDVVFSKYGYLFGIPTAWYGVLTYLVLLVLTVMGRSPEKGRVFKNAPLYIFAIAVWCIIYSIAMAYISAFILEQYCINCIGLYVVNIGLLITSFIWSGDVEGGRIAPLIEDMKDGIKEVKVWGLVGLMCLIMLGSCVFWSKWEPPKKGNGAISPVAAQDCFPKIIADYKDEYPRKGDASPPVCLVEFSDFKCPHCSRTHDVLKKGMEKYGDKFSVYFVHYPLDSECNPSLKRTFHPGACNAAFAARCAQAEGKFWTYADILFSHQKDSWTYETLLGYGESIGIDPVKMKACMDDPETRRFIVEKNIRPGVEVPVQYTPTLFMNGNQIPHVSSGLDALLAELEKALTGPGEGEAATPEESLPHKH